MKKIVSTILAVAGFAAYVNAQGAFSIDTSVNAGDGATTASTSGGLVFLNGILDTGTDISLAVLFGTSSSTVTTFLDLTTIDGPNGGAYAGNINWIASQATGSGDMSFNGNGTLTDPNGGPIIAPGGSSGVAGFFIIEGWTGAAPDFASVTSSGPNAGLRGATSIFSIVLAPTGGPNYPDTHGMSSLNLTSVPEPTMLALAGLGGAALVAFRRRKI